MAVAFDAVSSGVPGQFTHTCTSASVLFLFYWDTGGGSISTLQYDGIPATLLYTDPQWGTTVWALVHPPDGTANVTSTGSPINPGCETISYSGDNDGTPDSNNTGSGTGSPQTASTTVVASNCWTVGFCSVFGAQAFVTTSNKTDRVHLFVANTSGQASLRISDSNTTVSPGSNSIIFSNAASSPTFGWIMISIGPLLSNISKVSSVDRWNIKKISSVPRASIKKISGVTN